MTEGIIDLHTHGLEGIDTRTVDHEAILKVAEFQWRAGVSGVCLSIYSGSIEQMRAQIAAVEVAAQKQSSAPAPGCATILGVHLEGPFLNAARCGALDPSSFVRPDEGVFRRLVEGFEGFVRIVTIAPELEDAPRLIRQMTAAGIRVNMGHTEATYAEAEAGLRSGARGITHIFNAMRPFHHREPGIAGFALTNKEIYVEAIGDLVHLERHALDLIFKAKGADRVILVSDSVSETQAFRRGEPRDREGRLLGGSCTLPASMEKLIREGFDREMIFRAATENPRKYLEG